MSFVIPEPPDAQRNPGRSQADGQPTRAVKSPYFGDYELLAMLARGSMGLIYKARQHPGGEIVALKVIREGRLATPEMVKRFLLEAELASGLDHPGIVPILEIGVRDGISFHAMAYIEGTNLARTIGANPLAPRPAAELLVSIAEAVDYIHERGVIHRDLKPANVLLDTRGRPWITDFGLAKRIEGEGGLSAPGMAIGTPCYMAPEQALGRTDVGPAADIYALGSLLYGLLTCRPPFLAATTPETLRLVASHPPVPLRRLNPLIPRSLETVVMTCLEKAPQHRYATAVQVADDLNRWLQNRPILARSRRRFQRWWRGD